MDLSAWLNQVGKRVTNGHETYEVVGVWTSPVVELRPINGGADVATGIDGLTARQFYPAINNDADYDHALGGYPARVKRSTEFRHT